MINEYSQMPASHDSERIVLGAIILDNNLASEATERLTPESFYNSFHQKVFRAMSELYIKSEEISPSTILNHWRKSGIVAENLGGIVSLTGLYHGLPVFSNLRKEIEIITEKHNKRELLRKLSSSVNNLLDDEQEFSTVLSETESAVFAFSAQENAQSFEHIHFVAARETEIARECLKNDTTLEPVLTGFHDVDDLLGTLEPELIILGARPSIGKTSLAINVAEDFAFNQNKTVAFFSLEMSKTALTNRIICSRAQIPAKRYKLKQITQPELERIEKVNFELAQGNLFINDQSDITPIQILSKCRKLRSEQKRLDLVVIDYLQMMQASVHIHDLRERVTQVSKELVQIKKELNVPIIAVASLSRASETGTIRKPRASDLRESGQIESDADQIWLLHRQGFYDPNCATPAIADFEIVKNRNGATGAVQLLFEKEYTKFKNLAR